MSFSPKDEFNYARKVARQVTSNNPGTTERLGQEFIVGSAMWVTGAVVSALGFRKVSRAFKLAKLMSTDYVNTPGE